MVTHSSTLAWRIPWTEEPVASRELDRPKAPSIQVSSLHRVCQGFDSFFNRMICFCFYCWILRVLCMFWRLALYQTCLLQIFWMFSFSWESYFKVCVIFWNPEYIIASKSQLNYSRFYYCCHFPFISCVFLTYLQ